MSKAAQGAERRRSKRRPILDSFSLFVVIPKKGPYRLKIHDASDLGLGFDLDMEGEELEAFPITSGETLEIHFYLNQSLYIALNGKVARLINAGPIRQVGVELTDKTSKDYKAFTAFLQMLDGITEVARFGSESG